MSFNRLNNNCPVFSRPKYPDVLWDGNTAAWYKHDDMRTVFKDGANRVSYWLDRFNYAVGANILPVPLNFMNVNWTVNGGAVKIDNDSYSNVAVGGLRNVNYLWTLNTTYRLRTRIRVTNLSIFRIYDWNATNVYWTYTGNGNFQDIDVCITVTAIAVNGIHLWTNTINSQVDFDYLIIEPIAGNHLIQNTLANQPTWSAANGLLFDGGNDRLTTLPFVFIQPEIVYIVFRQVTWSLQDTVHDGNGSGFLQLQQGGVSPNLIMYAGIGINNNNLPLNTFAIIRELYNGANSSFAINNIVANGNCGVNNAGGFNLGSRPIPDRWANIEVKEIILRRSADNAFVQQCIYDYLRASNGL